MISMHLGFGIAANYRVLEKAEESQTLRVVPTTLTDIESLTVLDVHCCVEREHDTKVGPRVVRRNADELQAVAADSGFQDWHTEYEIATLDIEYFHSLLRFIADGNCEHHTHPGGRLHTMTDVRDILLNGQTNAGLRPASAGLVSIAS